MEIVKVSSLSFKYSLSDKPNLSDISFSVSQGEICLLCGKSGSGKSTLLRNLKTCIRPEGDSSGRIELFGSPLDELSVRIQTEKIGYVSQSPDDQSVCSKVIYELSFGLQSLGLKNDVIKRRCAETAAFFGIEKLYDRDVATLSGGQKQLVNLASVMIMQPSLLLLDEPLSQLDPISSAEFLSMLKKINKELGTTIIMVEHELSEVYSLADKILLLENGKLLHCDTPPKTAEYLCRIRNEMFSSLPAPIQVYFGAEINGDTPPLSVSDGRLWLSEYIKNIEFRAIAEPEPTRHKEEPVAELKGVFFRYEKNSDDILKGLSLKIYKNEHLTILGGNGSGKTSMLLTLLGINKPYRGSVKIGKRSLKNKVLKTAYLPQDPQALFVRNTVYEDLLECYENKADENFIEYYIDQCDIRHLLKMHPFDLSGGERQRVALCKLLLTDPDILLLDEPTNGLDNYSKSLLAEILIGLKNSGKSIVTVTHDLEFCAVYSDRCAFFFDGEIVSDCNSRKFFLDNGIYTTACRRMTRNLLENVVTVNDALYTLKKEKIKLNVTPKKKDSNTLPDEKKIIKPIKKNKKSYVKKIVSALSVILFFFFVFVSFDTINIPFFSENKYRAFVVLGLLAVIFVVSSGNALKKLTLKRPKNPRWFVILTAVIYLAVIPLTVVLGNIYLGAAKYLFISLLIGFETMIPFFWIFERRSVPARELVFLASICALCVAGRGIFYMLPQFKPVTALIIIAGIALGSENGFIVGAVTMLCSNIFFGQGIWTPYQMFSMGLIGFLSGFIFKGSTNRLLISLFGFFASVVIYGGIMNPSTMLMARMPMNVSSLLSVYAAGLPLDLVHGMSTAVFLYIGCEPLLTRLERLRQKYGLIR